MSVGYVLARAGSKMGLNPNDYPSSSNNNVGDRSILLWYLNEASRELYPQGDLPGSLMEQVFKVNGDQTISMPYYVGEMRGVREYASMQNWHVNKLRPRYNQFNWKDMWRNYRLRGRQALMATVSNQSVGVISVPTIETPNVVVTLTGPTANATSISETITMDSSAELVNEVYLKYTTNQFLDYTAVKKSSVSQNDVTLQDVDGKLLTIIPNTEFNAEYSILDVSACPWLPQNTSTFDNYVEILYKQKLKILWNDADEYPCFDHDDILVNKIMQLWNEEQNKADVATAYDTKATRTLARLKRNANTETEDEIALVANPHDTMLKRIGTGLRRRYSLYAGRKY